MLRIADTFVVENPTSLDEALYLLDRYGERARLVAGGTDLLPNIKHGLHAPEVLISLKRVPELRALDLDGDPLVLGATLGIHEIAQSDAVGAALPALRSAARQIAGPQLRRMGTLGGNVCLDTRCVYINQSAFWRGALGYCLKKDGDACHVTVVGKKCVAAASNDTAPVLLAHDAQVELLGPRGPRTLALEDFYVNDGEKNNALEADEILTAVRVPRPGPTRVASFQKLRVRDAIDFPLLNLCLAFDLVDGQVKAPTLVVSAIAARPRRVKGLPEGPLNDDLVRATGALAFKKIRPLSNIDADLGWRREMVPVLVARAFAEAAGGAP